MKFTLVTGLVAFLATTVIASPAPAPEVAVEMERANELEDRAEHHKVTLVNKCGSGKPVFLYQGHSTPRGSGTINGPLKGGVAWIDGLSGHNCLSSGVNCGIVEFTLINPDTDPGNTQNAADYSLLSQGNHKWTYKMNFHFDGSCTKAAPGPCTGNSKSKCPGGYLGSDTTSGRPVQCVASNAGITITFC